MSAAGRVPVLSSFASSCWYSGCYISPIQHLSAFGCRGCTETEPSSLSFLHLHTSAPDAFSVPCSLPVLGLHISQPWSSQCSAQLQLPPGRSNVCWNPPPTLQSPLNCPPLHSVRTGQCLRASSAGITLVFMSTHSFVLSAGAVDAVIATAALCFPPSTAVGDLVSNTLMVQIGDAHIRKRALSKISSIKTTVELHPIRSCVFLSDHLQL